MLTAKPDHPSVHFVHQGRAWGGVGKRLLANNFDTGVCRPWEYKGKSYVTLTDGMDDNGEVKYKTIRVANETATLGVEEWRRIDTAVTETAYTELRIVNDLVGAGLVENIDGMGTPALSYQTEGDITGAKMSMRGLREAEKDRPEYGIATIPIPIIHKDTSIDLRELANTRRIGRPIDLTMIRKMTRKCAELADDFVIGNVSFSWAQNVAYGIRNFPYRITKVMTNPTAPGYTPDVTVAEVVDMRQSLINKFRRGPYRLYLSSDWEPYMDLDYSGAYNGGTLRERLGKLGRISSIETIDNMTGFQMIMIQMTSDVIEVVVGLSFRAVEWQSGDGMEHFIKILGIIVPRIRVDQANNVGIAHGTAP